MRLTNLLRTTVSAAVVGACAFGIAGAASAQQAPQDQPTTIDDIIVTAQKRVERLQDVPAAVSVISGDAIANKGAVNLEGAQYLVPSLNFRKSGTTLNQSLFLRGVSTSTFSISGAGKS